jgi:hypothetical protein
VAKDTAVLGTAARTVVNDTASKDSQVLSCKLKQLLWGGCLRQQLFQLREPLPQALVFGKRDYRSIARGLNIIAHHRYFGVALERGQVSCSNNNKNSIRGERVCFAVGGTAFSL